MNTVSRSLLTIVTEAALEPAIVKEIENLGARGYTITDARGKGSHGVQDARWEFTSNIRIEVICERQVAEAIAARLRDLYSDNYALVLFIVDAEVLRADKF